MLLGYIHERLRNVRSCVIYKDVESFEPIDRGAELVNVRDVADNDSSASARTRDLVLNLFEFTSRSAEEKNLRSCLSESKRCRSPKTAARAGYKRDTVVQPEGFRENGNMGTGGYNFSPEVATCPA
jgi:hypothetical protein